MGIRMGSFVLFCMALCAPAWADPAIRFAAGHLIELDPGTYEWRDILTDLNGDGYPEIVQLPVHSYESSTTNTTSWQVLTPIPDSSPISFEKQKLLLYEQYPSDQYFPSSCFFDADNDGDQDFFYFNRAPDSGGVNRLHLLLADNQQPFKFDHGWTSPLFLSDPDVGVIDIFSTMQPVDMDRDGDLDVLLCFCPYLDVVPVGADFREAWLLWYENDGGSPPSFTEHRLLSQAVNTVDGVQAIPQYFSNGVAGDVDGDGDVDIVGMPGGQYETFWGMCVAAWPVYFENIAGAGAAPQFTTDTLLFTKPNKYTWAIDTTQPLELVDLNSDGHTDIVAPWTCWMRNRGLPGFSVAQTNFVPDEYMYTTHAAVADFDCDGRLDVAAIVRIESKYTLLIYTPDPDRPGYYVHTVLEQTSYGVNLQAGDLDRDGDPDLVLSSVSGLYYYQNLYHETNAVRPGGWAAYE